jgi:hypothetical protein
MAGLRLFKATSRKIGKHQYAISGDEDHISRRTILDLGAESYIRVK